jgi:peptidoglycan/LPS O-acetylase OafA/YrhL
MLPPMEEGTDRAAPDALAPPPRHPRFPLLDGLRAVAAFAVLLVHVPTTIGAPDSIPARLLLHMNVGVTIFFLISGFLLYRPFIAHRTGGPPAPGFGVYAKRRALRIFPAYWLVLTAVVLLPSVTATTGSWAAQYGLVFTMFGHSAWSCADCGLSQTWSLVVELTFYATLPLYVLLAERIARGRAAGDWLRTELLLLAALAIGSIVLHFVIYDGVPPPLVGGSLLSFFAWFALGMGLAAISVAIDPARPPRALAIAARHPGVLWVLAAAGYFLLCMLMPATPFVTSVSTQFAAFVAFGLIALLLMLPAVAPARSGEPAGRHAAGVPGAILGHPLVAWLGLVSYGIFLWHLPLIHELERIHAGLPFSAIVAIIVPATVAVAAASYYLVERPLLKLKYRRREPDDEAPQLSFGAA